MEIRVECYSGFKANESPLRFILGEQSLEVVQVLDRWYDPDADYFRVRAQDGNLYVLRHRQTVQVSRWTLEAFRRERNQ